MIDEGYVTTDLANGVLTISFFHPKSNSLPGNLLRKLAAEIEKSGRDRNAKVIVLKSDGERAFCAGASFDELASIKDFETGVRFFSGFAEVINAARKCPKFILGRIHGKAVGGGVGIVSACDYALATEKSSVRLSEISLGIGPFVIAPAIERKIGTSGFAAMTIDHEWRSAEWCMKTGLYQAVYPNVEKLDFAIRSLAEKLAKTSPDAAAELKKMFWRGTDNWDELLIKNAEISGRLVLSDFAKNFIDEFKSK
ncbi:MAG: enoyl-CoA hydratase/isomerase family protein [Chlorobi bacterium]|nr:enoyl-CoA hydratase/isomerase family protein [Chlorobiota bacterium]